MNILAVVNVAAVLAGTCPDPKTWKSGGTGAKAYKFLSTSNATTCCAACAADNHCDYVVFNTELASKGNCHLKVLLSCCLFEFALLMRNYIFAGIY